MLLIRLILNYKLNFIFLLFRSLLFLCIKKKKKNVFLKKFDILVILVDFYLNLPRFFFYLDSFRIHFPFHEEDPDKRRSQGALTPPQDFEEKNKGAG